MKLSVLYEAESSCPYHGPMPSSECPKCGFRGIKRSSEPELKSKDEPERMINLNPPKPKASVPIPLKADRYILVKNWKIRDEVSSIASSLGESKWTKADQQAWEKETRILSREFLNKYSNDEEWLIGFDYDMDGAETIWAVSDKGNYIEGKEFDRYVGGPGEGPHYEQQDDEDSTYGVKFADSISSTQSGRPTIIDYEHLKKNDHHIRIPSGWWDEYFPNPHLAKMVAKINTKRGRSSHSSAP